MSDRASYRQILRSTSITAGASGLNLLIGLAKLKAAAVLLGPTGIGLIGLMQSVMATAAAVASMGLGTVGTQRIAESAGRSDEVDVARSRLALFWGSLALATIGGVAVWACRKLIASTVFGNIAMADEAAWLAAGVALSVVAGAQTAVLNGLRRIGDLARLTVGSALASSLMGIVAIMVWGKSGIALFVIAVPLASVLLGRWYTSKLPPVLRSPSMAPLSEKLRLLVSAGAPLMASALVVSGGHLVVRSLVQSRLGGDALGYFQAAWTIAMTYVAFVLAAMGNDFFPRLSASINDRDAANRLINQQTEVAVLLAGPVLLLMIGLSPLIVTLLFTREFSASGELLRLLAIGDVFKIVSWPLGFMILARGNGRIFLITESVSTMVFVGVVWALLPLVGILAVGVGFIAMYVVYLAMVFALARRHSSFAWAATVTRMSALLLALSISIALLSVVHIWAAAVLTVLVCLALAAIAFARLSRMAEVGGPLGRFAHKLSRSAPLPAPPLKES